MKRGDSARKKSRIRGGASDANRQASRDDANAWRSVAMHQVRCGICNHPEREEIERAFLDWQSPREIARQWKAASYRAIYRHARALRLYEQRRQHRQWALDRIIECAGEVKATAAAVVSAVRLGEELDREGKKVQGFGGRELGFTLSLEGLPRTDAVTGHAEAAAAGRGDAMGCPPAEETP